MFNPRSGRAYIPEGPADLWVLSVLAVAKEAWGIRFPLVGPVWMDISFRFPRPERLCRAKDWPGPLPHDPKPDRDNLEKTTMDALKLARVLSDDSIVCAGEIRKGWETKPPKGGDHYAGASIRIARWILDEEAEV